MIARRMRRDESGVSAVIVVLSLTAIFSAAVLSVDAGSVWRTRRNLITDTDAAALAAAMYADKQGARLCSGSAIAAARGEAEAVLGQNGADSRLTGFTITPTDGNCRADSGRVRVDARLDAELTFGGIFDMDDVNVASSSIAQFGPVIKTDKLRPIGICSQSEHFVEWGEHLSGEDGDWGNLDGDRIGPSGEIIHRIQFDRGDSGCGSASGNWDWLDFNGSDTPNGTTALRDWLTDGYPNEVSLGDPATGEVKDCNPEAGGGQDWCEPSTGATGNALENSLRQLRDSGIVFPVLVYDRVVDRGDPDGCVSTTWTGSGSTAQFCHVAFLLVRLHDWDGITGSDGWFDLEFVNDVWVGSIGRVVNGSTPTVHGVSLCGGGYGTNIDQKCDV